MKRILLLLTTVGSIFCMYWFSPYHQAEHTVVELIQPQISDIRDMVILQGKITDQAPIRLYAEGPATVAEVYVTPGQKVRAGQPLLRLDPSSTEYDTQEVAAAAIAPLQQALEMGDLAAAQKLADDLHIDQTPEMSVVRTKAYQLYSPVDCIVMEVRNQVGEAVTGLLPCVVLCDTQNLMIEAQAEEDTICLLREDMTCDVTVPAFQTQILQGRVTNIMPYAQQSGLLNGTSSAKTTIHIAVEDKVSMRPGYRAEVKVITEYKQASMLVPYEAVMQDDNGREYVKVVEENIVVRRFVQTGSELEHQVEVVEGIANQDVLLRYPNTVQEGAFIQYDLAGTDPAGA